MRRSALLAIGVILAMMLGSCQASEDDGCAAGGLSSHLFYSYGIVNEIDASQKTMRISIENGNTEYLPSNTPEVYYGRLSRLRGDFDSLRVGAVVGISYFAPVDDPVRLSGLSIPSQEHLDAGTVEWW